MLDVAEEVQSEDRLQEAEQAEGSEGEVGDPLRVQQDVLEDGEKEDGEVELVEVGAAQVGTLGAGEAHGYAPDQDLHCEGGDTEGLEEVGEGRRLRDHCQQRSRVRGCGDRKLRALRPGVDERPTRNVLVLRNSIELILVQFRDSSEVNAVGQIDGDKYCSPFRTDKHVKASTANSTVSRETTPKGRQSALRGILIRECFRYYEPIGLNVVPVR